MRTHTEKQTQTQTHIHTDTHTHTHTKDTHTCAPTHTHRNRHRQTQTQTDRHTHAHAHTHRHTQKFSANSDSVSLQCFISRQLHSAGKRGNELHQSLRWVDLSVLFHRTQFLFYLFRKFPLKSDVPAQFSLDPSISASIQHAKWPVMGPWS